MCKLTGKYWRTLILVVKYKNLTTYYVIFGVIFFNAINGKHHTNTQTYVALSYFSKRYW